GIHRRAKDGFEALELLQADSFDLVLLDVMMPDVSGHKILEQLQAEGKLTNLPVIVTSEVAEFESAALSSRNGTHLSSVIASIASGRPGSERCRTRRARASRLAPSSVRTWSCGGRRCALQLFVDVTASAEGMRADIQGNRGREE
ncbi:MAG: response regulator, partial [Xanthobacteraceae bacterium]